MTCPSCGGPTRYIAQYNQSWCDRCRRYAGAGAAVPRATPPADSGASLWIWLGVPVALLAILGGVMAVYMFRSGKSTVKSVKSTFKAWQVEGNVQEIANGAEMYFLQEQVGDDMEVVTGQLPASTAPTPARDCCSQGGSCDPDPSAWEHPTWQALDFQPLGEHYYTYQFIRADDGQGFEVRAVGDLDCDGEQSTYSLSAWATDDGFRLGEIVETNSGE